MQCCILDWSLEHKKEISGHPNKVCSLVNTSIPVLVSELLQTYHGSIRANIRRKWVKGVSGNSLHYL